MENILINMRYLLTFIVFLICSLSFGQTLINKKGEFKGFIDNGVLYDSTGKPIAYLKKSGDLAFINIFTYNGTHIGTYDSGYVFDMYGEVVLGPNRGKEPIRPLKQPEPNRAPPVEEQRKRKGVTRSELEKLTNEILKKQ